MLSPLLFPPEEGFGETWFPDPTVPRSGHLPTRNSEEPKFQDMWVFDDPAVGLRQEPFVSGADQIIDVLTEHIPNADAGFKLIFSPQAFPGYSARLLRDRPEFDGTWYVWPERGMEGWLCPALFKYFETAPPELYVQVSPK